MEERQLKVLMYPWLAMGHIIPYFELAKKFAEKGHKVTLMLPKKAKLKILQSSNNVNNHPIPVPDALTLHTITIPHVHPLPLGTQLNSEIPFHLETHLATAFDLLRPHFHSILATFQPNLVFYDFAHWVPQAVSASGTCAKCVTYFPVSAVALSLHMIPFRNPPTGRAVVEEDTCVAPFPPGYPSSDIAVNNPKTLIDLLYKPYGKDLTFYQRITTVIRSSDAIAIKTCKEIEGKYCDYLSSQYNNKPVFVSGPVQPDHKEAELNPYWAEWLGKFGAGSVVYCAFGSQAELELDQFQEFLLGLEMTKLPFLIAFKPPKGYTSVADAFPEGFKDRVGERGVVTGEWVQQAQILSHPSVGCFVSHCGSGSIWESLLSKNQIVLIPYLPDQKLFSEVITKELKVGVKVETGENGTWISKQSLCKAIKSVMDEDSEIGRLVKMEHQIWRRKLAQPGFMDAYLHNFIQDLQALLHSISI
ncbi:unnamed protein product [Amaranthus hypochondriacus]